MSSNEIDIILDHYRNPRNYKVIEDADIKSKDSNPLCGDVVELYIKLDGDKIAEAAFRGKGCAISQASASMLTERLKGMGVEDATKLKKEDILEMLGIELSPVRLKCALLSLKVLKAGLYVHLGKELEVEESGE